MICEALAALRGAIAVRPYAQQSDEIANGRIGIVELARRVGTTKLGYGQSGAPAHFALQVGVVLCPTATAACRCNRPVRTRTCLTCDSFLTTAEFLPAHRDQLTRTEQLIAQAEADGHQRLIEMNEPVRLNLIRIIDGLEALGNELAG